jgi:hypothetical protein
MVQQVKHFITRDGEATTSIVVNNVRFIDEPTDMDVNGNPSYCQKTNTSKAKVKPDTLEYESKDYFVGDAQAKVISTTVLSPDIDLKISSGQEGFIYAKDLLAISQSDVKLGKINGIYLDEIYAPNKISQFYKAVFKQKNNFMVGSDVDSSGKRFLFMYDSIHEAAESIKDDPSKSKMLSDYEMAMSYIKRDICSEEAFYCGILGLSIDQQIEEGGTKKTQYITKTGTNKDDQFDNSAAHSEYFGVSSDDWKNISAELKSSTILKPGMMSSITESQPMTSFIEERKVAVRTYLNSVRQQAEAVRFTA